MTSYKVTFNGYDGKPHTETHYFNLTETELQLLNARYGGSLPNTFARLSMTENLSEIVNIFMDVFQNAYGRMDDDQIHFRKNEKIWEDFASSPAFDKLFMEILSSGESASKFMNGIMPKNVREAIENADTASEIAALQSADVTVS